MASGSRVLLTRGTIAWPRRRLLAGPRERVMRACVVLYTAGPALACIIKGACRGRWRWSPL